MKRTEVLGQKENGGEGPSITLDNYESWSQPTCIGEEKVMEVHEGKNCACKKEKPLRVTGAHRAGHSEGVRPTPQGAWEEERHGKPMWAKNWTLCWVQTS